jgi:hypothetical protein
LQVPKLLIGWVHLTGTFGTLVGGDPWVPMSLMTRLKQRNDETVVGFVQRFREVRNKCYSLNLGDKQLAELAFYGLLPTLREKYASHDFESLSQLVSRMS